MGANDGIVSIAGIVIGVLVLEVLPSNFNFWNCGCISRHNFDGSGEYVSVSTQRDAEKQAIIDEKDALKNHYQREFNFIKMNTRQLVFRMN